MGANAYILADTCSETVIEYADDSFDLVTVQIFTKEPRQSSFAVYPKIDEMAEYICDGEHVLGRDISRYGIAKNTDESKDNWHEMLEIKLHKCKQ